MQTFKFPELTAGILRSIVKLNDKGIVPEIWQQMTVPLAEEERQQIKSIAARLLKTRVFPMNEATIWSRAISPLLMMAEQGQLQIWAKVPLSAKYPRFTLEGIADGLMGKVISDGIESPCLVVVQAKLGLEEDYNPIAQLVGEMLAAARLNWEENRETPQEIFGCCTIRDTWIFLQAMVSEFESDQPVAIVVSSGEYNGKLEIETIFRILKFITGKRAPQARCGSVSD